MRPVRPLLIPIAVLTLAAGVAAQPSWQDVLRNLRNPNPDARLSALDRLERANHVAAVEPVAPLLRDLDDRVQFAALDAELTFFLNDRIDDGGGKSRAQRAFDGGPLLRTATAAPAPLVDALVGAMRDENARVRFDAVHVLGFVAESPLPPEQLRAIADELDHYDPIIRAATARVLGRLRQRGAGERLMAAVDDSNSIVRQFAVESLGFTREDLALPKLRDLIARADGKNIDGLLLAVARIGSPDDQALFRAHFANRSTGARRAAAEGAGRIGDRDALESIERLFNTDRNASVRLAAAFALHALGQTQTHVIASMLAIEDVSEQAREYLFELGRDSVPGIQSALVVTTNDEDQAVLLQAIGYLGNADDLSIVEPFLKAKSQHVLRAASAAATRLRRSR